MIKINSVHFKSEKKCVVINKIKPKKKHCFKMRDTNMEILRDFEPGVGGRGSDSMTAT